MYFYTPTSLFVGIKNPLGNGTVLYFNKFLFLQSNKKKNNTWPKKKETRSQNLSLKARVGGPAEILWTIIVLPAVDSFLTNFSL